MSKLDEIRERLEAATPGPWEIIGGNEYLTGLGVTIGTTEDGGIRLRDAEFVAHAPSDVAALLRAVDGVLGMHRNEYRDKWGHPATEDTGAGGWCYTCGRFTGVGCPSVATITAALEAQP